MAYTDTYIHCMLWRPVNQTSAYVCSFHFYSARQCSHCKRCNSYGNSVRLSVRLSHAGIVSKRRHVVFWTIISTIQDEKSAAKFHNMKTISRKVVAQSITFRVVSNILAGGSSVRLISERKGSEPHWKQVRCLFLFGRWHDHLYWSSVLC